MLRPLHLYPIINYEDVGVRHEFHPWQFNDLCPYCGVLLGSTNKTVDHIPSKTLLNRPFPANLAAIPCCLDCNRGFSSDEEYFAVLLECVKHETFDKRKLTRESVLKTVTHTPAILETIKNSVVYDSPTHFTIASDDRRVKAVLLKLVKAHLCFENSHYLINDNELLLSFSTLDSMSETDCSHFAEPFKSSLLPEVGSRASNNVMIIQDENARMIGCCSPWIEYQKETYSFCVAPTGDRVKILLHEFLCVSAELTES
jgi:hypothetical protein